MNVEYRLYADDPQDVVKQLIEHFGAHVSRVQQKLQTMQANPSRYKKRELEAARTEHSVMELAVVNFLRQVMVKPTSMMPKRSPIEEVAS